MLATELERLFATQVEAWAAVASKGATGCSADEVEPAFAPLRERLETLAATTSDASAPPFVLVLPNADPRLLVTRLRLKRRSACGVVDRNHGPDGLSPYRPIEQVELPDGPYALVGVERGDDFRGVPPRDATATILDRGRTTLTIVEGLALALVSPGALAPNHCFSLAGSRRGDKRVPALWISAGAPKLGWCWDGNPHGWLGVASAAGRVGAV